MLKFPVFHWQDLVVVYDQLTALIDVYVGVGVGTLISKVILIYGNVRVI